MTVDRSKTGRSSVRTGKRLENRYANMWSEWTGETFRRRRTEGRGSSVTSVEGVADVICTTKTVKFAIESKKEKKFSFTATPFSSKSIFWQWWSQVYADAMILTMASSKYHFHPFLHFKPTPASDFVAFPTYVLDCLSCSSSIDGYTIKNSFGKLPYKSVFDGVSYNFDVVTDNVFITSWQSFTQAIDPKSAFYE